MYNVQLVAVHGHTSNNKYLMLKKSIFLLLVSVTCYAQQPDKFVVKKDKNGKPLPVCAVDQKSTEDKPCRQMTTSQRAGSGGRS